MSDASDDVVITQVKYTKLETWSTCLAQEGKRLFPKNDLKIVDHFRVFDNNGIYSLYRRTSPRKFYQIMSNPDIRRIIIEMLDIESIRAMISPNMQHECTWLYTYFVNTRFDPWIIPYTDTKVPNILLEITNRNKMIKHADVNTTVLTQEARNWLLEHRGKTEPGLLTYHNKDYLGCIKTNHGYRSCTPGRPCETAYAYWATFVRTRRVSCWRQLVSPASSYYDVIASIEELYSHDKGDSLKKQIDDISQLEKIHNDTTEATGILLDARYSPVTKFGIKDKWEHFNVATFPSLVWETNACETNANLSARMPGTVLVGYGIRTTMCGWKAVICGTMHLHFKVMLRRVMTYIHPKRRFEGSEENVIYWKYHTQESSVVWDKEGKVVHKR